MGNKKKRFRRSVHDVKQVMEPYKNVFQEWAYAGDKKTMQELFPENIKYWQNINITGHEEYFSEIPEALFNDPQIIKRYGENLRFCRVEKGWTLEEAANVLGIDFQQLQQIEMGERKGIHRNLLLLFCGIYRVSPEMLMGLSGLTGREPNRAMVFYPEENSRKAGYVVDRLIYQDQNLLDILCYLSQMPTSIRNTLSSFLKNAPIIKIYSSKQVDKIVKKGYEPQIPTNHDGGVCVNPDWGKYYGELCEASIDTPDLLDVYVSIATADKSIWEVVLYLLSYSGFLPFTTVGFEKKQCQSRQK